MCSPGSPPKPTPPPEPLKDVDQTVQRARDDQRRRAALMAGLSGTNRTGGLGVAGSPAVAIKTLLGQ